MRSLFTTVILLLSVLCALPLKVAAQREFEGLSVDTIDEVVRHDMFQSDKGFYLFSPSDPARQSRLVVFVHGYGALNPMIYGNWIEHLVMNGDAVLFPRYQMSLFNPGTEEFVPNTVQAISSGIALIEREGLNISSDQLFLVGHSYGGVIIGNIAAKYLEYDVPKPAVAFLCEPGHGPFSGGVLPTYREMPEDMYLAVIVGDDDWTVGHKFGEQVYRTATDVTNRVFYRQFADANGDESIKASHYEPYSFCAAFDNGISNFTIRRAEKVSELNNVDTEGYWAIFDTLIRESEQGSCPVESEVYESLAKLGKWSDGTSVRPMAVLYPAAEQDR